MGWIANLFIIIGMYLIGDKSRRGFLFSILGEGIWATYATIAGMYDLAVICVVFCVMASINFWKWGQDATDYRTLSMESSLNHEGFYLRNDFRIWSDSDAPERYSVVSFNPFTRHHIFTGARPWAVEQAYNLLLPREDWG